MLHRQLRSLLRRHSSTQLFTKQHEWVQGPSSDGLYAVGITKYALKELGDVTFLELPTVGDQINGKGLICASSVTIQFISMVIDIIGSIESVKAASDIYSPISGEIVAANQDIGENPKQLQTVSETEGIPLRMMEALIHIYQAGSVRFALLNHKSYRLC